MKKQNKTRIALVLILNLILLLSMAISANGIFEGRRSLGIQCVWNDECDWPLICGGGYCRAQCRSDRDCSFGWVCRIPTYEQLRIALAAHAVVIASQTIYGVGPDTPRDVVLRNFIAFAQCVPPPGWPNVTPPPGGWPSLSMSGVSQGIAVQPSPAQATQPPAVQVPPSGISEERDTDRPGSDFFSTPTATLDDCIALCQKESRCRVYTYFNKNCWLKDKVPAPSPLPGAVSGVVRR